MMLVLQQIKIVKYHFYLNTVARTKVHRPLFVHISDLWGEKKEWFWKNIEIKDHNLFVCMECKRFIKIDKKNYHMTQLCHLCASIQKILLGIIIYKIEGMPIYTRTLVDLIPLHLKSNSMIT